jgi:hypothetical protein
MYYIHSILEHNRLVARAFGVGERADDLCRLVFEAGEHQMQVLIAQGFKKVFSAGFLSVKETHEQRLYSLSHISQRKKRRGRKDYIYGPGNPPMALNAKDVSSIITGL